MPSGTLAGFPLAAVLRLASFFLRETLCFSAHASQRVCFGMACLRQSLQSPSSLALSRQSLAALLEASLCSGCSCLGPSCSLCSSGIFLTLGGEAFFGGLGFGSDVDLGFAGFRSRRLSPGSSRTGVDEGLLSGSYLPPNLLGIGTRSAKVAPTTRFCGPVRERGSPSSDHPRKAWRPWETNCAPKEIARDAGVPVAPNSPACLPGDAAAREFVVRWGFPCGQGRRRGGGRGMRLVNQLGELDREMESASRESQAAFGDGRVFLERFIPNPATWRSRCWPTSWGILFTWASGMQHTAPSPEK